MLQGPDRIYRQKIILYYAALFAVAFVALLPVTLLQHPLKYDMIDQYYPWRYLVGECLQEGVLPLWNPYQVLGEPIHANPQSSAWYPVTWFFGYLFGYDIYIISYDFFLHVFLAGMGMFFLGRQLKLRNETAFLMAVGYMLSGLFIGNAQHMTYIVSGTWIPFAVGAFIKLKEKPTVAGAVSLALVLFLFISGGYPSFLFILLYLLLVIFIFYLVNFLRRKEYASLLRFSAFLGLAAVATLLMSSVVMVSVYHLQSAMTRGGGVTLEQALFGAFTPQSMISFILPYAVIRNMDFYNTDLSMSNGYFGLLPLVFFFVALTLKRPMLINLFLGWGVFCLLASLGEALPVREFLYHYVPFMDQFRFPSAFRVYIILSFLIVAGFGFERWMENRSLIDGRVRWILLAMGAIIAGFALVQVFREKLDLMNFIIYERPIYSFKSTVAQHIFFQALIQLIMLAVFFILFLKMKMSRWLPAALLVILCLDMAMATRLNGPYTVYSHIYNSKDIYEHSGQFPDGFPLPDMGKVIENRDSKLGYQTFWRNLNIFHKKISHQGYNPMQLKNYVMLTDDHPVLFETITSNPPVYLSDRVFPLDSLKYHEKNNDLDPSRVYLANDAYAELRAAGLKRSQGDTAYFTAFSPVRMVIYSKQAGNVMLNLLQSNYHGWKAFVDGNQVKLYTGNIGMMCVVVPAGEHEVEFRYRPRDVRFAFYFSLVVILLGLVIFIGDDIFFHQR
jgi:hypothetical protein